MANTIKIKRSTTTAQPANSTLAAGELAYSSSSGKLFIGHPDGSTAAPQLIGYLSPTEGTLTASKPIVTDSNSKIDRINVDNLRLDGNAITSTDTNGNITITPNGSGDIVLDGQNWPQADGSTNQYLKTDGSGQLSWAAIPSGSFTISDNQSTPNTDTFSTGDTLTFEGGTGITTTVSDDNVAIAVDEPAAIYNNSGSPALTSGVTAAEVRTLIGVDASGTDNSTDVTLAGQDYLTISGQVITANSVDLTDDVTGALPVANGGTGATSASAARTALGVDAAGTDNSTDVTLAGSNNYLTISGQTITRNDVALGTHTSGNYAASVSGTANEIEVTGSAGEGTAFTIGLPDDVTIGDALTVTGDGSVGGDLTVTGNLTVSGTTTTVNSETVTFDDNILVLNNNYSGGSPTENAGIEVERGTVANVAFRWNETSDKWQITEDGSAYKNLIHADSDVDGGTF